MNVGSPIVILGTPRSGTSMTASIFAAHGVWYGSGREADLFNPRGYYENPHLREWRLGSNTAPLPVVLEHDGYEGGPWLVKHTPRYWEVWRNLDPTYILVRRPLEASARSSAPLYDQSKVKRMQVAREDNKIMDRVKRRAHRVAEMFTDEVVGGKFLSIAAAFKKAGLEFDPRLAEQVVEPELWH